MVMEFDVKPATPARMESSALVDACVNDCGKNLDIKVMPDPISGEINLQTGTVC
jgi:hypothetical protein